jgi:hypothetical protein
MYGFYRLIELASLMSTANSADALLENCRIEIGVFYPEEPV